MPANYVAQTDSVSRMVAEKSVTRSVVRRAADLVRMYPPDRQLKDR